MLLAVYQSYAISCSLYKQIQKYDINLVFSLLGRLLNIYYYVPRVAPGKNQRPIPAIKYLCCENKKEMLMYVSLHVQPSLFL